MSDAVACDCCGKLGKRRTGTVAPEGWFYGETKLENDPFLGNETWFTYACSEECKKNFWKLESGTVKW